MLSTRTWNFHVGAWKCRSSGGCRTGVWSVTRTPPRSNGVPNVIGLASLARAWLAGTSDAVELDASSSPPKLPHPASTTALATRAVHTVHLVLRIDVSPSDQAG